MRAKAGDVRGGSNVRNGGSYLGQSDWAAMGVDDVGYSELHGASQRQGIGKTQHELPYVGLASQTCLVRFHVSLCFWLICYPLFGVSFGDGCDINT